MIEKDAYPKMDRNVGQYDVSGIDENARNMQKHNMPHIEITKNGQTSVFALGETPDQDAMVAGRMPEHDQTPVFKWMKKPAVRKAITDTFFAAQIAGVYPDYSHLPPIGKIKGYK